MTTLTRVEKRQRSVFGKLVKYAFIGFNLLMIVWLISGIVGVANVPVGESEAHKAGAAIGAAIGFGMVLTVWVFGALLLGLFVILTRGDKVIVEQMKSAGDRWSNEPDQSAGDADAMIARYLEKQATAPRSASTGSMAARSPQGGFGRRGL